MLEPSNHFRRSQRRSSHRTAASPVQPASAYPQAVRRRAVRPRSGLQRLILSLMNASTPQPQSAPAPKGAALPKRGEAASRRERLQQRRERLTSSGGHSFRVAAPNQRQDTQNRAVIPLDAARSGVRSRSPVGGVASLPTHRPTQHSVQPPQKTRRMRETNPHGRATPPIADRQPQSGKKPQPRSRSFSMAAFVQGVRLVILGVGVWAIVGTTLSIWNPDSRSGQASQAADETSNTVQAQQLLSPGSANSFATLLEPRQEISELATRITPVTQEFADLIPGVFVMDLDSGDYYSLNGDAGFSAASMIKVPVLVAFFQDVDAGKIRLDEMLTLQQEDLAGESGEMQFDGVGTQYTALETAIAMIAISDNTATNILIRRLGGMQALNQRFQEWGLQQTVLHNLLPDIEGTNMTSPRELSMLIARVGEGELVSMKSRDRLLDIMQTTVTNSMLPASLSPGATISHKTGDIGSVTGDSGLVDLPSGKRYAITVMVKRPHSDARGYELVFRIGEVINRYFGERSSTSTASTSPPTPGTPLPADAGNPSPATAQPAAQ